MKNLNLNTDFLLDIWADLKARNLAPVAIGLVVALVAMPALLLKGEKGAAETGPIPILASSQADQGAEVEVAEELADRGSKLDSYNARDPFAGKVKPSSQGATSDGTASVPSDALGGDSGKPEDSGNPLSGLGGSSGPSDSSGSSGGLDLGGSTDPGVTPAPAPEIIKRRRYRYNYELDLKFGRPGQEKRYDGVTRLSFLPEPSLPVLLFMGVPVNERSAIFFVHPGLTHQGEGSCVPSPKNCNFLQLKIGEQHYLSANDREFRIELLKVHRVKLKDEKKARATARKASNGRRSARSYAEGASPGVHTSSSEAADEPEFPWLVDGIG